MTEGLSAIGSYGSLGSAGLYGSYYDPYMMSMMGGYGSYGMMSNPMMMNPMGMMGMYNPAFMGNTSDSTSTNNPYINYMKSMYSAQNEIQKMQLQGATEMHAAKEQAQVYNAQVHDRAFFNTVAVNGDVQNGIREIYDAIRKGDMDNVAQKYYELKQVILNKYSDHFTNSVGGLNDKENIDHYISTLYSEIGGGYNPGAPKPDLRTDIMNYGENPFEHGMNTTFMGNSGHNKLSAEECLNQIYGTRINDAGSKAHAEEWGRKAGKAKEFAIFAGGGAALGATALGIFKTIPKIGKHCNGLGKWAWAGAAIGAIGDILWQTGVIGNRA